jgi:hypothetical protein
MHCGETIFVKDLYGTPARRYIAQCGDRFMVISHTADALNGQLLPDWKAVLRDLVAQAVPAKLTEKARIAETAGTGHYTGFPLTYPLSAAGLADLLGVLPGEVREQLADLAVSTDA